MVCNLAQYQPMQPLHCRQKYNNHPRQKIFDRRIVVKLNCCSFLAAVLVMEESTKAPPVTKLKAQNGHKQTYSTWNGPLRADDVKPTWKEITHLVNMCCSGARRTVSQCSKRLSDIRQRANQALVVEHRDSLGAGGALPPARIWLQWRM